MGVPQLPLVLPGRQLAPQLVPAGVGGAAPSCPGPPNRESRQARPTDARVERLPAHPPSTCQGMNCSQARHAPSVPRFILPGQARTSLRPGPVQLLGEGQGGGRCDQSWAFMAQGVEAERGRSRALAVRRSCSDFPCGLLLLPEPAVFLDVYTKSFTREHLHLALIPDCPLWACVLVPVSPLVLYRHLPRVLLLPAGSTHRTPLLCSLDPHEVKSLAGSPG